jgi:hypothetical protein
MQNSAQADRPFGGQTLAKLVPNKSFIDFVVERVGFSAKDGYTGIGKTLSFIVRDIRKQLLLSRGFISS